MSGAAKKRLSSLLTVSSEPLNVGAEQLLGESQTDNLIALIEEFHEIDLASPGARLNETSISDNNGARIEL